MDTPRTDKEVELIESSEWEPRLVVSADFARSLEREIAELQQKIADMELQNELARLGF